MPQLALQQNWSLEQVDLPQGVPAPGLPAHTAGSELKRDPGAQVSEALQIQMPPQSAPP
jgi:hypothetical protein